MSHITDVKLKVRDLDALEEACEELGLELRRGQTTFAWWGTFVGDSRSYGELDPQAFGTCAHAIRVKGTTPRNGSGGPWEIGVVPARDGDGFVIGFDTYGTAGAALLEKVGRDANRLRQEYAAAVAVRKARKAAALRGFTATKERVGGRLQVRLRKR